MYNANNILKTYYYNAIKTALPSATVFKNYVPNPIPLGTNTDAYFLISNVQNINRDTINKHDVRAFVTIGIYTRQPAENDGLTMDDMATALFALFPTPQDYPVIDGYQVASAVLESDNELTVDLDNGNIYLNRQIIFSHILSQ